MTKATARKLDVQQRQELFASLVKWVGKQGGAWIVSSPGGSKVRIECQQGSELPERLRGLGYSPRYVSSGTRNEAGRFVPVDTFEMPMG